MKRIKDSIGKFIESVTHKGVKTICHPRSKINGHIPMTTSPENYFKSFYIDEGDCEITESGAIVCNLRKESNIRELESDLNKLTKEKGGYRASFLESGPRQSQKSWIDGSERFMATRNETPDGISYILRADLANELVQRGKHLIQCDEAFCEILMPTEISVNLNKYSVDLDRNDNDIFD